MPEEEKIENFIKDLIEKYNSIMPGMYNERNIEEYINNYKNSNDSFEDIKQKVIKQCNDDFIIYNYNLLINSNNAYKQITLNQPYDLYIAKADLSKGFSLPYIMYIPKELNDISTILIDMATPRVSSNNFETTLRETLAHNSHITDIPRNLINKCNTPIMIPIIPRFDGYYTTALGSKIRNNDIKCLESFLELSDIEKLKDIDKQIINMINDAQSFMKENLNVNISEKVIMNGYSAGSKAANNFTILHPDKVCGLITGGATGLNIRPETHIGEYQLNYPLGVNDIPNFNKDKYSDIPKFNFIGATDQNDPALCECILDERKDVNGNDVPKRDEYRQIIPIKDKNGKYLAHYKDCYTDEEVNTIYNTYGIEVQERFDNYANYSYEHNLNIENKKYPGNHMTVFKNNSLFNDVINFVEKNVINKKIDNKSSIERKQKLIDLYKQKKILTHAKNAPKVKSAQINKGKTLSYSNENNNGFINILIISLILLLIGILIYINL